VVAPTPETFATGAMTAWSVAVRQMERAPFRFQPRDWFGFFAAHGWRPREIRYLPEEGSRLGPPAPLPWKIRLLTRLFRFIVPAQQRTRLGQFAGYVLLEPVPVSSASSVRHHSSQP
jgi:hypothetical protein